jgi:hypothetical protein
MALTSEYLTRSGQTAYDLAIQLYGNLSNIGKILELFPNLNSEIDLNSSVMITPQKDPIAKFFLDNRLIVATEVINVPASSAHTFDSTLFKFDSTLITFDSTI